MNNSKKGIGIDKKTFCKLQYVVILSLKPESAVWSQGVGLTATYFGKTKFFRKGRFVCAPECKDHSGLQKVGGWLRQSH